MTVPELQSAAEIVSSLKGETKDPKDAPVDPRDEPVYEFDFAHTDPRGKVWRGHFKNRILTIKQRRLVKVTKAQLAGGVPMAALDADAWEMNEIIAHLSVSLDPSVKGFPDWANNLEDLYDERLVFKLYEEVALHEARFSRREEASGRRDADADRPAG